MSHLQWSSYEGYGQEAKTKYGYSQAVRIGDEVHCSGQGGWDRTTQEISKDLETEINQAFENVGFTVKDAGGKGWADVYKVRSYHTGPLDERLTGIMVKSLKAWCPDHQPLWTYLGVRELGLPEMHVEIEVIAHTNRS